MGWGDVRPISDDEGHLWGGSLQADGERGWGSGMWENTTGWGDMPEQPAQDPGDSTNPDVFDMLVRDLNRVLE